MNCDICGRIFSLKTSLVRHKRIFHGIESESERKKKLCPELNCTFSCYNQTQLRNHVLDVHETSVGKVELQFSTWKDFDEWKDKEEEQSMSKFTKRGGDSRNANRYVKKWFLCHRSGIFKSRSTGLRELKSQGSCKMGSTCTASIEAEETSQSINVIYHNTHFGHSNEFSHLTLTESERKFIRDKLAMGIKLQRVLDDVRENIPETGINRLKLLTRHDLNNIMAANSLQEGRSHENDAISVDLIVKEMGEEILFYKPQGRNDEKHRILKDEDFVLIIMTKPQINFLQKYGKNIICIDSTHGTIDYNFNTITVLVVDDFGAGIPVAFMISTHEDAEMLQLYFSCIKEKVGCIKPNVVMTDDAPAYINSWTEEMGRPSKHLLCTWHVDKNWRENLKKINGSNEKKAFVYKSLRTVLEERDVKRFHILLKSLVEELCLSDDTKDFGEYFKKYYSSQPEVWAYCYRVSAGINTNMYLENLHKVLKHCYLDGKKNKRLDKLIAVLLKIVRDKCFDRMIKVCKGQVTHRIALSRNRHKRALASDWEIEKRDNSFVISSDNKHGSAYIVEKIASKCEMGCQIICRSCNICYHMYTCTCPDNMIRTIICKHIHATVINTGEKNATPEDFPQFEVDEDEFVSLATAIKEISEKSVNKMNIIDEKAQMFVDLLKSKPLPPEKYDFVVKKLDELLSVFGSTSEKNKEPANKNVSQQRRLVSVKKRQKRKRNVEKVIKPTLAEKSNIGESLQHKKKQCVLIHTGNDHSYCA